MRSGAAPRGPSPSLAVIFALFTVGLLMGEPLMAQLQEEPPDTIQVDSTLLRIQRQLLGLAKPPGIDST